MVIGFNQKPMCDMRRHMYPTRYIVIVIVIVIVRLGSGDKGPEWFGEKLLIQGFKLGGGKGKLLVQDLKGGEAFLLG